MNSTKLRHRSGLPEPGAYPRRAKQPISVILEVRLRSQAGHDPRRIADDLGLATQYVCNVVNRRSFQSVLLADHFTPAQLDHEVEKRR